MQFPVEVADELRLVEVGFAREPDVAVIRSWHALSGAGDKPLVQDAAEYAGLATGKWDQARAKGRVAGTLRDLVGAIKSNPEAELLTLLVARAEWHQPAPPLGFCLVRRTWAHNLFVDFLGNDPRLLRPGAPRIKGIATGLLYTVMALGQVLDAGRCLIEATDQSFGFYRKKFRLMELNDLFSLTPAEQWHFLEKTRAGWEQTGVPLTLALEPTTL